MKVLLLGAGGFIGGALLSKLRTCQCEILATTHNRSLVAQDQLFLFDITHTDSLDEKFEIFAKFKPDVIINCIMLGVTPQDRAGLTHESNQLISSYIKKLIHLTSSLVFQNHTRLMHFATNLASMENNQNLYINLAQRSEQSLNEGLLPENVTIVRLPRIYGPKEPNGRFIADSVMELTSARHVAVEQPCRQRAYVHVDHLVDAVIAWVINEVSTEIQPLRIRNIDAVDMIARVVGCNPEICIQPNHLPLDSPEHQCEHCGSPDDDHSLVVGRDPKIYLVESIGVFQNTIREMVIEFGKSINEYY